MQHASTPVQIILIYVNLASKDGYFFHFHKSLISERILFPRFIEITFALFGSFTEALRCIDNQCNVNNFKNNNKFFVHFIFIVFKADSFCSL